MQAGEMGGAVTLLGAYVEALELEEASWFVGRVWFQGSASKEDGKTAYSTLIEDIQDLTCYLLIAKTCELEDLSFLCHPVYLAI
jgi:hypothetical protein